MTPRCSSPASNHGDGRGCSDENCPRHGNPEGEYADNIQSELDRVEGLAAPRLIPSWVFTVPTEDPAEPRYMETLDELERGGH